MSSTSQNLLIITGTPGTGKSTLAKALAKRLHCRRLSLHRYYKRISSGYNKEKQSYDIEMRKFIALVKRELQKSKKTLLLDSHISHYLPKNMVALCLVLTCSGQKKLRKRLQERGYSKEKIEENVQAEIFQVCLEEARERGHKVLAFDVCKTPFPRIISRIRSAVSANLTKRL